MPDAAAQLRDALAQRAAELGFARLGVARASALDEEGERLRAWLLAGHHDGMSWMAETADVRVDPRHPRMLEEAVSVVVLATPFLSRQELPVGIGEGRIARYAFGRDYHNVLGRRLRKLDRFLRERGHRVRHSVDSVPVFERAWAVRAGLGFVGKNCCLIIPGLGSHVFLSTLVTSAWLPADEPMREGCGRCTACLDACPTAAFVGPRELDARLCISNLTIEREDNAAPPLRKQVGDWLFGCDACQDVCPYNRTSPPPMDAAFEPHPRLREVDLPAILRMEEEAFLLWSEGSPMRRSGLAKLARNAAVVLGNTGSRTHLPVLQEASLSHASDVVREAARWALEEIEAREALGADSAREAPQSGSETVAAARSTAV